MKTHQILSVKKDVLFETKARSFQECLEHAIKSGVALHEADFRFRNMAGLTMDGADMPFADFTGCNLDGANMSEANLEFAVFTDCTLFNTCFAGSNLRVCDFMRASFGATDIAGADLSDSAFSTLSCFSLDFSSARAIERAYFRSVDGRISLISQPPIVISGLARAPIIFLDEDIYIGHKKAAVPYVREFLWHMVEHAQLPEQ